MSDLSVGQSLTSKPVDYEEQRDLQGILLEAVRQHNLGYASTANHHAFRLMKRLLELGLING